MDATTTPTQVREHTRTYVTTALSRDVADGEDIFAAGFVNSLFAAQLVTFVEDRFAITVEDDELELRHFASIDAITAFVTGKTAHGATSAGAPPCD